MPVTITIATLVGSALAAMTTPPPEVLRYLALGDSYTIGEGVAARDRWPEQLVRALAGARIDVAPPEIIAKTGWTTDELDAAISERDPAGPFTLVTLLVGVNDQYRGRSAESYRPAFRALLQRAICFAGGEPTRVIVVSIPDWGVTPFNQKRPAADVAREIDAFNAVNQAEAQAAGVAWLDITDLTRAQPRAVVRDGLHPDAAMYTAWTTRLVPLARVALRR